MSNKNNREIMSRCIYLRIGNSQSGSSGWRGNARSRRGVQKHERRIMAIGLNLDLEDRKLPEFYLAEGQRLAHMNEELSEALRESEAELRQTLDFAPQLISVYGPKRERLYANRNALDCVGLSLAAWRQTLARGAFVHPDDRARELDCFERALATGPYCLDVRLPHGG